jgi:hypothetical protein
MSRRGRSVRRKLKASSARRGLLSLFGRHWQTDGGSLKVAHTNKAQPYPNRYAKREFRGKPALQAADRRPSSRLVLRQIKSQKLVEFVDTG